MRVKLRSFRIFFGDKDLFDEAGDRGANNISKFMGENGVETIQTQGF